MAGAQYHCCSRGIRVDCLCAVLSLELVFFFITIASQWVVRSQASCNQLKHYCVTNTSDLLRDNRHVSIQWWVVRYQWLLHLSGETCLTSLMLVNSWMFLCLICYAVIWRITCLRSFVQLRLKCPEKASVRRKCRCKDSAGEYHQQMTGLLSN